MSIELLEPVSLPEPWEIDEPRRRRLSPVEEEAAAERGLHPTARTWNADQYQELSDIGVLGPEERVELINGEILVMSPQKSLHMAAWQRVAAVLAARFPGAHVRTQGPLALSPVDLPEPDVAVVQGVSDDYEDQHPTSALLLVEVSDTTLRYDTSKKADLYAGIGVADYWVCDLRNVRLIVYRDPVPEPAAERKMRYASVRIYDLAEEITPLAGDGQPISIRDLLPKNLGNKKQ
jgi:Uma2 family endonuclease